MKNYLDTKTKKATGIPMLGYSSIWNLAEVQMCSETGKEKYTEE